MTLLRRTQEVQDLLADNNHTANLAADDRAQQYAYAELQVDDGPAVTRIPAGGSYATAVQLKFNGPDGFAGTLGAFRCRAGSATNYTLTETALSVCDIGTWLVSFDATAEVDGPGTNQEIMFLLELEDLAGGGREQLGEPATLKFPNAGSPDTVGLQVLSSISIISPIARRTFIVSAWQTSGLDIDVSLRSGSMYAEIQSVP